MAIEEDCLLFQGVVLLRLRQSSSASMIFIAACNGSGLAEHGLPRLCKATARRATLFR
jgi:hypothetical protein